MVKYVDSKASSKHPVVLTAHLDRSPPVPVAIVGEMVPGHPALLPARGPLAGLMTDQYPPFRLDQGGTEPTLPPAVDPAIPQATDPAGTRTAS